MHRKSLIRSTAVLVVVTCLLPVAALAHPAADSAPGLALFARLEAAWAVLWQAAWNEPAGVTAKEGICLDPNGGSGCVNHAATGPGGRPERPGTASDAPARRGSGGGRAATKARAGS
jgi:hypothetical protein